MTRRPASWMLSDALALLARAEAIHRHFLDVAGGETAPCWEPPLDLVETEREIVAFVALPGVEPGDARSFVQGSELVLEGRRMLPDEVRRGAILRMELPQGRFARRVPIPPGRYDITEDWRPGLLVVRLVKHGHGGGQ